MKRFIFAQIFVLGSFIMFSACTEKGLGLDEGQQTAPTRQKVSSKQGILVFSSFEELENTLRETQGFDASQRLDWENCMGFTSFGSLANQVYGAVEGIDFKSEKEFYGFVENNSGYLQIVEDLNEETQEIEYSLLTKEYNNPEQWFMNENRMYIIDNLVYRFYDNDMAVVGPVESVKDLIGFTELDTLKMPKDCIYYKHILEASDGSGYPGPLTDKSRMLTCFYDKVYTPAKRRIRAEIRATSQKATVYGVPSQFKTRYVARHYHELTVERKFPLFNMWYREINPNTQVFYSVDIKSASLNYNLDNNGNNIIIGYASDFDNGSIYPPCGAYFDFFLWFDDYSFPNYPMPWTCIVAWNTHIFAPDLNLYDEQRSYSSGYENGLIYEDFLGHINFAWWWH